MSGNARGASSAFCLLFRLAQLKPTDDQVQAMLEHEDSPYIRAVGAKFYPTPSLQPFENSPIVPIMPCDINTHASG